MKITRFGVKNFRAIGQGPDKDGIWLDLSTSNLLFLIGKNNTGKSAILEAYDMFVKADRSAGESDFHKVSAPRDRRGTVLPSVVEAVIVVK